MSPALNLSSMARRHGIELTYEDNEGRTVTAPEDSVRAALAALGHDPDQAEDEPVRTDDRMIPPVLLAHEGRVRVPVPDHDVAIEVSIADKAGREFNWTIPADDGSEPTTDWLVPDSLDVGYHDLVVRSADRLERCRVLVPPSTTRPLPERALGIFVAHHALWSSHDAGPHLGHLATLSRLLSDHEVDVVSTLPLLAGFTESDPSPYAPVSRRFWNETLLDPRAVDLDGLSVDPPPDLGRVDPTDRMVDHRVHTARMHEFIDRVVSALREAGPASPASASFEAFRLRRPEVTAYARFRGMVDTFGPDRSGWPARSQRRVVHPDDAPADATERHEVGQWLMGSQLERLADELGTRGQRLYLDLPVGVKGDGYDTFARPELFATGMSLGAPPDDFFSGGQNWGFPPMAPLAMREDGHRFFASAVRQQMEVAGILRVDHVMGLFRQYWIPDGADATEGVYVRFPAEELFAVLAIESAETGCAVVGENLGTVPPEIDELLRDNGVAGMHVSQFSFPDLPTTPSVVASVDTHDTPTMVGWWNDSDLELHRELGNLDEAKAARRSAERDRQRKLLAARIGASTPETADPVKVHAALIDDLTRGPADLVVVTLEDLWGEPEPQNVPGTGQDEHPNWRRRTAVPVDELLDHPEVTAVLDRTGAARRIPFTLPATRGESQ